ncbi:MAG: hypothetical protein DRO36_03790 [Candidatus Hecatellales archaeon]|nr:MAG: hypothetical protein DRO36_03790 [Candidatus Hecatellales archaeon]
MALKGKFKVALIASVCLAVFIAVMVLYVLLEPTKLVSFIQKYLFILSFILTLMFIGLGFMSKWLLEKSE